MRRSREYRSIPVLIIATIVLGACSSAPKYDPFKAQREQVRAQVKTIALVPHPVPYELMDADAARATFEPIATEKLEAAGFEVIPSSVWSEIWRTAAQDVGGVYDAQTLEPNDEKLELVLDTTLHRLRADYGVDARLYFKVAIVELQRQSEYVQFCGKETKLEFGPTSWDNRLGLVTAIRTSCLQALLVDMEDDVLYGIRHGIEVFEIHARQTRRSMPREQRLTNREAIEEAASVVLDPLVQNALDRP